MLKNVNDIKTTGTSNLVKADYDTKISNIEKKILDHYHSEYITNQEFNKLTVDNFAARLKQAKLTSKMILLILLKNTDFDEKLKKMQ